jgi:hypothetical protein
MSETKSTISWLERNQAHLLAEFARLKELLDCKPGGTQPPGKANETAGITGPPSAIDHLTAMFELSPFERDLLLLCAGVEMDSTLAARCAEAQGPSQRPCVTLGLAMATLPQPHWSALTAARPLRHFRLLDVSGSSGLVTAPVRIDERVLHYLGGINLLDSALEPLLSAASFPVMMAEEHEVLAHTVMQVLADCSQYSPVVHLCGNDAHGHEDVAAFAAHHRDLQLFTLRVDDLPASAQELDHLLTLLERESLMFPAAFLLQCEASGLTAPARRLAERLPISVFLSSDEPVHLRRGLVRFDVNKPGPPQQRELWRKTLGDAVTHMNGELDELAHHFRLSARTILTTGSMAAAQQGEVSTKALWTACRSLAQPKLENLAQRIVPCAGWDDLVLPALPMQFLRQLAAQVWHRMQVYESWGFSGKGPRGLGVSALFCGDSGTGKTLAAEVLAHELGLDLYRIDLASVVSKYIGETEKNLKQIFDAAEEGGVVLLFDEADALFGKRGEVKDSHDRYANIEVGYLLQRMESYQGLAILTTNMKSSLDRAFQRRLRFIVTFPFPDAEQREAIWSKVFPSATPTRGLNLKKLSQLNVAGGNIRNIALNAAFLAAHAGTPVEMGHLMEAARLEAHKIDRPLADAEIRGWA